MEANFRERSAVDVRNLNILVVSAKRKETVRTKVKENVGRAG